jgi:succinate dehydrogenase/fumarate reductase cytochrome b subunit
MEIAIKMTSLLILIFILCIPFIILIGIGSMISDWWKGEEQVAKEEAASLRAAEVGLWKLLIILMVISTALILS